VGQGTGVLWYPGGYRSQVVIYTNPSFYLAVSNKRTSRDSHLKVQIHTDPLSRWGGLEP